jgi:hypothetical protein
MASLLYSEMVVGSTQIDGPILHMATDLGIHAYHRLATTLPKVGFGVG